MLGTKSITYIELDKLIAGYELSGNPRIGRKLSQDLLTIARDNAYTGRISESECTDLVSRIEALADTERN